MVANCNEAADDKAKKEKMMNLIKNLEAEMKSGEQFQLENKRYQEENLVLKQQLHNNVLNTPNAAAESCVPQLKKEIESLKAQETEAAEQE